MWLAQPGELSYSFLENREEVIYCKVTVVQVAPAKIYLELYVVS